MNDQFPRVSRAYELGRLRDALPWAIAPVFLACVSCSCCIGLAVVVALASVLTVLVVVSAWRGGTIGAAAKVGAVVGLVAGVAPLFCRQPVVCVAIAIAIGGLIGALARAQGSRRLTFAIMASVVAGLSGATGCVILGLMMVATTLLAVAAAAVPIALLPAPSRS